MRNVIWIFLVVFFLMAPSAVAEEAAATAASTGDAQLDSSLKGLNEAVRKDVGSFAKKLSRYYHMPEATVDWLLDEVGMTPGDAYMAAKVSRLSNRSVEDVADAYRKNRGKGWGAIAKKLGIKPGSAEFHALKKDEAGLFEEEEEKGKGKKSKQNKGKGKKKKDK